MLVTIYFAFIISQATIFWPQFQPLEILYQVLTLLLDVFF